MAKQVVHGEESRSAILRGINQLAESGVRHAKYGRAGDLKCVMSRSSHSWG